MFRAGTIALLVIAVVALSACATRPPGLTRESTAHLPRQVELSDVPFFPQDEYQCGPAALATVLKTTGVEVTPEVLTSEVYLPGKRGSLAVELVAATRSRGLLPYSLEPSLLALLEELAAGRPVLVMQNVGLKFAPVWHFAVIVGYDLDTHSVLLRSGTTERLVIDEKRFFRTWERAQHWALVVLEPNELPAKPDLQEYVTAAAGLEAIGRLRAAEQAYERAHARWPQSQWPVLGLANVSYRKGDLHTAEERYRLVLSIDENNATANNNLAELLIKRGCTEEARQHLERAAEHAKGTVLEPAIAATERQLDFAKPASCVSP